MVTRPYSKLKGDPYRAYEELPLEVRRALQESLVEILPCAKGRSAPQRPSSRRATMALTAVICGAPRPR
jgi:hypothetical protein